MNQIMNKCNDIDSRLQMIEKWIDEKTVNPVLDVQNKDNPNEDLLDGLLPLGTVLEFDELEERLNEKEFALQLVHFLKPIGGKDTHDFLFNILKRSLKNSVAMEFSMDGKKKKKPMRNTNFLKIIIKAAKLHRSNLDQNDAIKIISAWLAGAKLRYTRERAKLPTTGAPGEEEDHNC